MKCLLLSVLLILLAHSPLHAADRKPSAREQEAAVSVTHANTPERTDAGKVPNRGSVPSAVLALAIALFSGFGCYFLRRTQPETRVSAAFSKYAARMALVSGFYFLLKNADSWLKLALIPFETGPCRAAVSLAIAHFSGSNYTYFFQYFVDFYWGVCLLLGFPYIYFMDADTSVEQDKYVSFIRTLYSLPRLLLGKKPYWSQRSRLGMLTTAVKLFFIPYLTSWVINNFFHQLKLSADFHWNFAALNGYLVALFIYVDTLIFSFGYVVESKILKSGIKSVDPTLLGWVVCLWCYPPFSAFSFKIFDYRPVDLAFQYPSGVRDAATAIVTLLWGVFAWASLSLGYKASNLTNRGIVMKGPYRFIRHPAYGAKLAAWLLQGIFLGQYGTGMLLGLVLIYWLRAWTEERHLSMDPEYGKYKKQVPWRFVPGVI